MSAKDNRQETELQEVAALGLTEPRKDLDDDSSEDEGVADTGVCFSDDEKQDDEGICFFFHFVLCIFIHFQSKV